MAKFPLNKSMVFFGLGHQNEKFASVFVTQRWQISHSDAQDRRKP
jgi:hypothetical protein